MIAAALGIADSEGAMEMESGSARYPYGPKSGWEEMAREIAAGERVLTRDELRGLVEWLQDLNWPGSLTIGDHLGRVSSRIRGEIERVLNGRDLEWQRGLLRTMCHWDASAVAPFAPHLEALIQKPQSPDAIENEVAGLALECLIRSGRIRGEAALACLARLRQRGVVGNEQAGEIKASLGDGESV